MAVLSWFIPKHYLERSLSSITRRYHTLDTALFMIIDIHYLYMTTVL